MITQYNSQSSTALSTLNPKMIVLVCEGNSLKSLSTLETHKRAIHAYDKAIEFDHQNLDSRNQKGNVLFDLGGYYSTEGNQSLECYATTITFTMGYFGYAMAVLYSEKAIAIMKRPSNPMIRLSISIQEME
jgi:hypothetical protein